MFSLSLNFIVFTLAVAFSTVGGAEIPNDLWPAPSRRARELQAFPFRRYIVDFRGISEDESACAAPNPTATISCATKLVLGGQEDTSCVQDGDTLTCSGGGRVLVDCQARNNLIDLTTALAIYVQMDPPQDLFTCSNTGVGQGVFIVLLCPDDTTDFEQLACVPLATYRNPPNSSPLCLSSCSGASCSNQDLSSLTAQVVAPDSCLWEPSTDETVGPTSVSTPPPSSTPLPPTLPSPTVSPTSPIPTQTPPPEPFLMYATGGCIGQNELGITFTATVRECALTCLDSPSCVSFEYSNDGRGCQLSSSCSSLEMTVNEVGNAYNWFLKNDGNGGPFVGQPYMAYFTGGCRDETGLGASTTAATVRDCIALCDASTDCLSFAYDDGSQMCRLSSTCTDITATDDASTTWNWYVKVAPTSLPPVMPTPVPTAVQVSPTASPTTFPESAAPTREPLSCPNTTVQIDAGQAWDTFGASVAVDGDTVVAGAPRVEGAYVFTRTNNGTWAQEANLTTLENLQNFGYSVDIDGDTIVVGDFFFDDENAGLFDAGAAFVFLRADSGWTQQSTLRAADEASDAVFGRSVAISGDIVVVGAPGVREEPNAGNRNFGAVYVFRRTGTTWTQEQKLDATDRSTGDRFGESVDLDGDFIVIGTGVENESVYVFSRSGESWTEEAKLLAVDGAAGDWFGVHVAISGDSVIVASPGKSAAYVFVQTDSSWIQQAKLVADDGIEWAKNVGSTSVAIDGDVALVGAFPGFGQIEEGDKRGSVYVFERAGTDWTQVGTLVGEDYDGFGSSVAIDAEEIVVGSPNRRQTDIGSVYVFSSCLTTKTEAPSLSPSVPMPVSDTNDEPTTFGPSNSPVISKSFSREVHSVVAMLTASIVAALVL